MLIGEELVRAVCGLAHPDHSGVPDDPAERSQITQVAPGVRGPKRVRALIEHADHCRLPRRGGLHRHGGQKKCAIAQERGEKCQRFPAFGMKK
ncbi:hypothetical protein GCM10009733_078460 [Nonomuraea maheshkhaliensis]|uniref:Uncharacterized protein n=1 Tax=Nonomuraea maheshkhaliensis TaxID=419590 RepID=A0ABN2GDC1_9ACTN